MNRREALINAGLLTGYAFSAGSIAAILSGCKPDGVDVGWQPSYLSSDQNEVLIKLIDRILPKTDTPSASDVGVHKFIDKLMNDFCTIEEQNDLKSGLDRTIEDNPKNIDSYLTTIAQEAKSNDDAKSKNTADYKSREFFTQLRSLTLLGYYTSEQVCTDVLIYDPIPGEYIGCYPLENNGGRAWAL